MCPPFDRRPPAAFLVDRPHPGGEWVRFATRRDDALGPDQFGLKLRVDLRPTRDCHANSKAGPKQLFEMI
jgi:hypothetical protein